MILLMNANWYFSMNEGEECESEVCGVFETEKDYQAYLVMNKITAKFFDSSKYYGEDVEDISDDKSWYYKEEIEVWKG